MSKGETLSNTLVTPFTCPKAAWSLAIVRFFTLMSSPGAIVRRRRGHTPLFNRSINFLALGGIRRFGKRGQRLLLTFVETIRLGKTLILALENVKGLSSTGIHALLIRTSIGFVVGTTSIHDFQISIVEFIRADELLVLQTVGAIEIAHGVVSIGST